jgi:hypothetical protein
MPIVHRKAGLTCPRASKESQAEANNMTDKVTQGGRLSTWTSSYARKAPEPLVIAYQMPHIGSEFSI